MIVFITSLSVYVTSIMSILSTVYCMHLVTKAINFFGGRQLYDVCNSAYMVSFKITNVPRKIGLSLGVEWMSSPITCLTPFLFHTEQQGEENQ